MSTPIIMLIEDNPGDVTLTQRALRKANVLNDMIVARTGEEALDYLFGIGASAECETHQMPLVILLDLKLPGMRGIEVLQRIRHNRRTTLLPVVVLTSSKDEEDILQSYKNGANSYIRKPVDFNRFVEAMNTIGVYWMMLNEPPPGRGGEEDGNTHSCAGR